MFLAQLRNNPCNINIAKEYYTDNCIKEEIITEENDDGVNRFVELTPAYCFIYYARMIPPEEF